jgi:hypothetical protein
MICKSWLIVNFCYIALWYFMPAVQFDLYLICDPRPNIHNSNKICWTMWTEKEEYRLMLWWRIRQLMTFIENNQTLFFILYYGAHIRWTCLSYWWWMQVLYITIMNMSLYNSMYQLWKVRSARSLSSRIDVLLVSTEWSSCPLKSGILLLALIHHRCVLCRESRLRDYLLLCCIGQKQTGPA